MVPLTVTRTLSLTIGISVPPISGARRRSKPVASERGRDRGDRRRRRGHPLAGQRLPPPCPHLFEKCPVRALALQRGFGGGKSHRMIGDTSIAEARVCTPSAVDSKRRGHRHQRKIALPLAHLLE